jgi:predicted AlkP superfamily pyrophosphatase or phosphodiesterase
VGYLFHATQKIAAGMTPESHIQHKEFLVVVDQGTRTQLRRTRLIGLFVLSVLLLLAMILVVWLAPGVNRSQNSSLPREEPIVIVLGLDGFSADLFQETHIVNLKKIASEGVRIKRLRPAFPSKTFPNFYSLVTGLHPETHGIVDNSFYDPETNKFFSLALTSGDASFYNGEPIWNTRNSLSLALV